MKKLLLSMMVLGMGSAFALTSAEQSEAMSACIKKGGTQAECQKAGQSAQQAEAQAKAKTGAAAN